MDDTGRITVDVHRICRSCGYANGYTIVGKAIDYRAVGPCEWCGRNTDTASSADFGWPSPPAKRGNRIQYDR
jgi:hypothetical protein